MQIPRYTSWSIVSAWFAGKQRRTKRSIQIIISTKRTAFLTLHIVLKLFSKPLVEKHHMLKNKQHNTQIHH